MAEYEQPPVPVSVVSQHPPTFGLRALAKLTDLFIINILSSLLLGVFAALEALGVSGTNLAPWLITPFVLFCLLYFAIGTSYGRQTLGYRLAGLRVVLAQEDATTAGFWRCLARSALNWLSYGLACYGVVGLADYVPVAVTASKRALHDILTGTRVIAVGRPRYPALAVYTVLLIVTPVVIVFGIIRPFMLQAFYMPSPAMAPTLPVNSRFLVNKLCYRIHAPQRGDIVEFLVPPGTSEYLPFSPGTDFIKRIVGLPGDQLRMAGGKVLIYGKGPLPEPYIKEGYAYDLPQRDSADEQDDWFEKRRSALVQHDGAWWIRVPQGAYFVLGDNRNDSNDSHIWGFLPRNCIIGKATLEFVPRVKDL